MAIASVISIRLEPTALYSTVWTGQNRAQGAAAVHQRHCPERLSQAVFRPVHKIGT